MNKAKIKNKADGNTANKAEDAVTTEAAEKRETSDNNENAQDVLYMNDVTIPSDTTAAGAEQTTMTEPTVEPDSEPVTEDQSPSQHAAVQPEKTTVPSLTTVKKGKKARKLTPEQIDEYAADLAERAKAGQFPDATIPFEHAKQYYNVSTSVMNEVMLRSILEYGLTGYKFDYSPSVPPKAENECFLNDRFMIMIGKSILEGFNEKLSPENQLKKNDKFIASFTGDELILTLKR